MATLTSKIRNVKAFSRTNELPLPRKPSRVSLQFRRRLACRATAEEGKEGDNSAYPQAAAPSSPGLYTGYIKKDSAGISVIDVVEPAVYVEGSGSRPEGESGTSAAVIGALLALGGAAAALTFLGANTSQLGGGLTLSQYADKFSSELSTTVQVEGRAVVEEMTTAEAAAPALFIGETAEDAEEVDSPVAIEAVQVFEVVPVLEPQPEVQAIVAEPEVAGSPVEADPSEVSEAAVAPALESAAVSEGSAPEAEA